jgi:hypothetical protein
MWYGMPDKERVDLVKAMLLVLTGLGIIAYAFGWGIVRNMLMAR